MEASGLITVVQLFENVSIKNTDEDSTILVDLQELASNGIFSVHAVITGSGASITITYKLSHYASGTYLTPGTASDICTAVNPGAGGLNEIYPVSPELSRFMKINVAEGADVTATVNLWLAIQ